MGAEAVSAPGYYVPPAPLETTEDLRIGDVVQVAVQLTDKQTGQPYWWKRFACVTELPNSRARQAGRGRTFRALTLKMQIDPGKDHRVIDLTEDRQVVTKIPEDRWPQGVIAMRMKWIHRGLIPLDQ